MRRVVVGLADVSWVSSSGAELVVADRATLAELVVELTGSKSQIVLKPLPKDDPHRRRPDTTLAESELEWRAHTKVKDGLIKTIADFDARLKQGAA